MTKFFFAFLLIIPAMSLAAKMPNNITASRSHALSTPMTVYTHSLPPFNQITVQGSGIRLKVVGGQKQYELIIKGSTNQVGVKVQGNVLLIQGNGGTKPTDVTVWTDQVVDLQIKGNSLVQARQLGQLPMTVISDDASDVYISGVVNLRQLIDEGSGNVMIYWVNSPELQLQSRGSGNIQLAGIVKVLHARLSGHSNLDAPYLRVYTALIQTMQNASAKVLALNELDAFAGDHSNIYYYKAPKHLVSETQAYGNVLQLDYWN